MRTRPDQTRPDQTASFRERRVRFRARAFLTAEVPASWWLPERAKFAARTRRAGAVLAPTGDGPCDLIAGPWSSGGAIARLAATAAHSHPRPSELASVRYSALGTRFAFVRRPAPRLASQQSRYFFGRGRTARKVREKKRLYARLPNRSIANRRNE